MDEGCAYAQSVMVVERSVGGRRVCMGTKRHGGELKGYVGG